MWCISQLIKIVNMLYLFIYLISKFEFITQNMPKPEFTTPPPPVLLWYGEYIECQKKGNFGSYSYRIFKGKRLQWIYNESYDLLEYSLLISFKNNKQVMSLIWSFVFNLSSERIFDFRYHVVRLFNCLWNSCFFKSVYNNLRLSSQVEIELSNPSCMQRLECANFSWNVNVSWIYSIKHWVDTISENQVFYLLEMNAFAGLFTDISKGLEPVG